LEVKPCHNFYDYACGGTRLSIAEETQATAVAEYGLCPSQSLCRRRRPNSPPAAPGNLYDYILTRALSRHASKAVRAAAKALTLYSDTGFRSDADDEIRLLKEVYCYLLPSRPVH
jgi:hypothetical protein